MLYRWYITDLLDGVIKGTNDADTAGQFAVCEDYFVVDTATGQQMTNDGSYDILEITRAE
jgi:hypothetical protein